METKTVIRTGVIGLGAMGLQMARHMVSKGFEVTGYDIDVDAMRRASEQGATTCLSAAQVGDHAEVVIVMVASDQQVEEVIAQSGLLDRLQPGSVICIARAEKDIDVALDLAQDAKVPMPIAGLVDQAMKAINQDKMKALLS